MVPNKKISILLAEDDEDDAFFFKEIIKDLTNEMELTIVENGVLAMQHLRSNIKVPDFIFLDLNMPMKDGIECLKEIKNIDSLKSVKTIILSTSSEDNQIQQCYDLGADLYIVKPSKVNELRKSLKNCLDKFKS